MEAKQTPNTMDLKYFWNLQVYDYLLWTNSVWVRKHPSPYSISAYYSISLRIGIPSYLIWSGKRHTRTWEKNLKSKREGSHNQSKWQTNNKVDYKKVLKLLVLMFLCTKRTYLSMSSTPRQLVMSFDFYYFFHQTYNFPLLILLVRARAYVVSVPIISYYCCNFSFKQW